MFSSCHGLWSPYCKKGKYMYMPLTFHYWWYKTDIPVTGKAHPDGITETRPSTKETSRRNTCRCQLKWLKRCHEASVFFIKSTSVKVEDALPTSNILLSACFTDFYSDRETYRIVVRLNWTGRVLTKKQELRGLKCWVTLLCVNMCHVIGKRLESFSCA